jgi:hypothetical protein
MAIIDGKKGRSKDKKCRLIQIAGLPGCIDLCLFLWNQILLNAQKRRSYSGAKQIEYASMRQ